MMVFNETEQEERVWLQQMIDLLKKTIRLAEISVDEHVDTLQEYKAYLWSNKDIDPHEIRSMRESILNHFAVGEKVIDRHQRLNKLLDIPYFGRIDFKEDRKGEDPLSVYIGIHTFYDPESRMNWIYDWRAPIAGMFYDHELGKASYLSPVGEIEGDISLKRQYRIRQGQMEFMIESSLAVHDDILQKELSTGTDQKMKNIVATIQREQNRIIRNEEAHCLIIQGVAGSGKTSIALHRIAYLLYTFKEQISSKDILILSPNKVFADYISGVLPELGEEAVPEVSMETLLSGILGQKYKYQDFFGQVDGLLHQPDSDLTDRISYKASFEFVAQLDRFILFIENHYFHPKEVRLNRLLTIPAEFIAEQFRRFDRYPMRLRFEAMTDYILELMVVKHRFEVTTSARNMLKKAIRNMFSGNDDIQVYKDFFEWIGKPELFRLGKNRILEYADLAPLAYLHMALEGHPVHTHVKHLLIDEMQDYSPVQYKVIQKLYPCRKTILGDAGQAVNPYGSTTAASIRKALVTGEVMKLCKSYRSTYEITAFAQDIRTNDELEPVERHGEEPLVIKYEDTDGEVKGIAEWISTFQRSGYKSLGIICKTESQAREMAGKLKLYTDEVYFISNRSTTFVQGIIITSAHMAKGLEFDEVIVPSANEQNFYSEIDRSMLYVSVTRAMHRLILTYTGKLTKWISLEELSPQTDHQVVS